MTDQIDLIIEELKQNTLTIETIEENELKKEDLFEVKIDSIIIGPFTKEYLKSYSEVKSLIDYHVLVKTMESILWVPLHQHPSFDKSESVSEIKNKNFYLLVNGRKVGPYRIEDIDFKVKNSEVLFTDLISEDAGSSWKKLYELEGFDLRKHAEENLPTIPGGQVLEEPAQKTDQNERVDAVGDLAKIGHQSSNEKKHLYSSEEVPEEKSLWQGLTNIAAFLGIIFITIFIFNKIDPFGPEKDIAVKKQTATKVVVPKAVKKTPPPKKVSSPSTRTRKLEEKKAKRKKAISKRKKRKKPTRTREEDPYPEDNDYLDEEPDNYYDDKPKKKKTAKKKMPKKSDDDYYDEEEDPY
ncbi:MAG: hypothetical protein DRQ88_08190 [Epsilonproteobacteria bacterium]|nr:MAG: hypothetical protein DRQ89_09210 [Campylobacterota bacterium]RLA66028.1 MAG: hypothetical protein DRQ88_08190 [Campylobacterota bacterium]